MPKTKRVQKSARASGAKSVAKVIAPQKASQSKPRPNSKQEQVLDLLRRPEGVTIAGIMKTTGWQQHSVRGFFAGVVRKRLGHTLESEKTDGERIYRVVRCQETQGEGQARVCRRQGCLAMDQRTTDSAAIEAEVDQVRSLGIDALRTRWRSMFGAHPPRGLTKDILGRMIAYRI